MFKNIASQKLIVYAFDSTTNLPKTGDSANLTAYVSKDYGSVTALGDTSATEMDSTNAKGYYLFDLTQAETDADCLMFSAKSSTANIVVIATPAVVFTVPANFTAQSIDSNGRVDVIKIAGTTQTARDIGASVLLSSGTGTGQLDFTSGVVKANTTQWLGTTVSTPTVAGVPNVNCKTWNDLATVALPLTPTVAGRTLDVSAGGEAGIDWANVGSPTTSLDLTGTTIASTQKVDVDTIKTNPVVNGGTITFPTNATVASTTNITAGTITTATNVTTVNGLAANVITAAAIDADFGAEIADAVWDEALAGHVGAGSAGLALSNAGAAADPWATALPGAYSAGSAGYIIGTNLDTTVSSRLATSGYTAPPTATENADALLKRDMSAVTGESSRSPLNAFRILRNKMSTSAGTLTVTKEDDTTTAWTATLTTDDTALPITGVDPS